MTLETLYLVVTCTLEQTRLDALKQVIDNLKSQPDQSFLEHTLVFDNGSTFPTSDELLTSYFPAVYKSQENVGFWSGIQWVLQNYEQLLGRKYKYIYVIESDLIHTQDAFQRLEGCEAFLTARPDVGLVRLEEFSVKERHLYDKEEHHKGMKRYAWVFQRNFITNKRVEFELADEKNQIYTCNFLAKIPALTRVNVMTEIFAELSTLGGFQEIQFQRLYHDRHPVTALLDLGIFHSKLGNDNDITLKGSYVGEEGRRIGYKHTRDDNVIVPPGIVQRLT